MPESVVTGRTFPKFLARRTCPRIAHVPSSLFQLDSWFVLCCWFCPIDCGPAERFVGLGLAENGGESNFVPGRRSAHRRGHIQRGSKGSRARARQSTGRGESTLSQR